MMKTFRSTEELLKELKGRVAVVGNASPTRELGELIDQYDAVIRINNFRIAGMERFVGRKTTGRCTSGGHDIEHRVAQTEFSPFRADAEESNNLEAFNRMNHQPLLTAQLDVHQFLPEIPKPSVDLALVELTTQVGLPVDLFGFDGLTTPPSCGRESEAPGPHGSNELEIVLRRPNVILVGATYPYERLYNYCHQHHPQYNSNVGLKLLNWMKRSFQNQKIIEFGAGNGDLARHLSSSGNRVTAVEVSQSAYERIACEKKIHGDAVSLALVRDHFDLFVSVDVLEHLTENDVRLVLREAARLADRVFISVSTRPSGLLGPNGENLHLTVRSREWWMEQMGQYFELTASPGYGDGQLVLEGNRKQSTHDLATSHARGQAQMDIASVGSAKFVAVTDPAPAAPALSSIPQSTEDVLSSLRGRQIAIVGNATPQFKFGAEIDSCDVVIRLNNFRLEGFEEWVGSKTDFRCTSGWRDIEHRNIHLEFSPFSSASTESAHVVTYNKSNARPLLTARTDIHSLLPGIPKPSTGCALIALCLHLGLRVDLFAFDGFKTGHYWDPTRPIPTTHAGTELDEILPHPNVTFRQVLSMPPTQPALTAPRPSENGDHPEEPAARRARFFLPAGYQSRNKPEYFEDSVTATRGVVWQPDVYGIAACLANQAGCTHILDLGCGHAEKLVSLSPRFDITGVDYGANLEYCRAKHSVGRWLEANFENSESIGFPESDLARSVVVCSDVIEHLVDPSALLRLLHHLLQVAPFAVLSTPERDRARGAGDLGPPKNKAHVREWTLAELEALLGDAGMLVQFIGLTRSDTRNNATNTQIAFVTRVTNPPHLVCPAKRGESIALAGDTLIVIPTTKQDGRGPVPDAAISRAELEMSFDQAEQNARQALELQPDGCDALKLLANLLVHRGCWAEARQVCERALHLYPVEREVLLLLAKCAFKNGELATTRAVLERALALNPDSSIAKENLHALSQCGPEFCSKLPEPSLKPAHKNSIVTQPRPTVEPVSAVARPHSNEQAFLVLAEAFSLLAQRRFAPAQDQAHRYQECVDYAALPRIDRRCDAQPQISVVIVAYKVGRALLECLDSLAASASPDYEIIVVDNGGNEAVWPELALRPILHIQVGMNVILAEGRNIGVSFARAPLACFVDDDAIVAKGYLASVAEAFSRFDIQGFRGKVLPKSKHPDNQLAHHYNLGDLPFPTVNDTEGNSAVRVEAWRAVGGQDPLLFGGEGLDLSYRIARKYGEFATIYWPRSVIHHDYAALPGKLEQKQQRHRLMRDYAIFKHPDLSTYQGRLSVYAHSESTRRCGHDLIPRPMQLAASVGRQEAAGPFISICIPTYNREAYLETALRSALDQTYSNFEVVIVDDGSTDLTGELVHRCASAKVRYFRKEHTGGPATRNRCLEEARGQYIVWLDSDDVIMPRTLERYVAELKRKPWLDVVYGDLLACDENLAHGQHWIYTDYSGWSGTLLSDLFLKNRIPNGFTLVRKECCQRLNGFDLAYPRAHDYEFWTRLAPSACFRRVDQVVGKIRRHAQSLTKYGTRVDTSYEANAAKALIQRHELRQLFPYLHRPGVPVAWSEAQAWQIAACVMLKYRDRTAALDFLSRTVALDPCESNTQLRHLVDQLARPSARKSDDPSTSGPRSWQRLIESMLQNWRLGRSSECAKICERLTELQPESATTMLLTGFCLDRWGDASAAGHAFDCLVRHCIEAACADLERIATLPLQGPSAAGASQASLACQGWLVPILSEIFGEPIPEHAVLQTLDFVGANAAAIDPNCFVATHCDQITPLLLATVRLTPAELGVEPSNSLVGQVQALHQVLHTRCAAPARKESPARQRRAGYSFCIITNGDRPHKLRRQIESIRALAIPHFEILVGGNVPKGFNDITAVRMEEAARTGKISFLRNALSQRAGYDHVISSDDDIVFAPDFYQGLLRFGEDYEIMSVRILNTDGTRFWDWATVGETRGHALLDYWENDPGVYVTGGFMVLKSNLLDRLTWNDALGYYQNEDVDFSRRLRAAGVTPQFNPFCRVTHDDDLYTRVGRKVMKFEHILNAAELEAARGFPEAAEQFLTFARRVAKGEAAREARIAQWMARLGNAGAGRSSGSAPLLERASVRPPASEPAPSAMLGPVDWIGTFLDHGSLSHVNRELTRAMEQAPNVCLRRVDSAPATLDPAAPVSPFSHLQLQSTPSPRPAVTVRHAWPPDWQRPAHGAFVVVQPWEFGSLPRQWVKDLTRADECWAYSNYVRQVYIDSGVPAEKVFVVPLGIDPARFNPEAAPMTLRTGKRFKFLFVGGTILRKGPDLLLEAFLKEFSASDDVCLVIKDFGGKSVYAGQTLEAQVRTAQQQAGAAEIVYLNDELPPEALPALYTACDCLVHPYRGEGFGLPVLEAMACGLPVIVTGGGATDDFATDAHAYRLAATRRSIGDKVGQLKLIRPGWLLEPDLDALRARMKWLTGHQADARAKGRLASEYVRREWTWARAGEVAVGRIRALQACVGAKQPSRSAKVASSSKPDRSPKGAPLVLPACALVGHLGHARNLQARTKPSQAWESTLGALRVRPFHPEAYLFLAEIAESVGDGQSARACAEQARRMAPGWKPARQFLNRRLKGNARPSWLLLPQFAAKSRPRLSVCLITKNEEKFIGQCLGSVKTLADQIVVMDTGSSDRTVAIAKELGAEVYSFQWCDDFSAARNAALEHVTGDWVLMLDADEELLPDAHDKIRTHLQAAEVMAWRLPIVDVGHQDEGCSYVPRLFRNTPALFYVGRVHEQVFSSIEVRRAEWGLENCLGEATLQHHGYTKELIRERGKVERNLRLLERAVEELPDEPNLLMSLGQELSRSAREPEALERYWQAYHALAAKPAAQVTPELRETLLAQFSTRLIAGKYFKELVQVLTSPLAAGSQTASLHFALGIALMELGRFDEAAAQMRLCLAKRNGRALCPISKEIKTAAPHHCLALCEAALGHTAAAEQAFEAGLKEPGQLDRVRLDFAQFLSEQNRPLDALQCLTEAVAQHSMNSAIWRLGGSIALSKIEFLEFACDWTSEAVRHLPEDAALWAQRGEALLLSQQLPAAQEVWERLCQKTQHPSALAALFLCRVANDQAISPSVPVPDPPATGRAFLELYRRCVSAGARDVIMRVNTQLDDLRQSLPEAAQILDSVVAEASA